MALTFTTSGVGHAKTAEIHTEGSAFIRLKVSQRVICADASDFLLPSEAADGFHDAHDNIQKPSED